MKIELCDAFFYRVTNDELNLCEEFNTSKDNLLRNNDKIKLYSGEWIKIKVNDYKTHMVKPMENLMAVASKYNVSVESLKETNNLQSEKLFIGQILKIYDKTSNKKTT